MRFLSLLILVAPLAIACPSKSQPSGYKQEWLDAHNQARAEVGVKPLEWSDLVEKSAKSWAKQMGKMCKMHHERGSGYGENLWMAWGNRKEIPIANSVGAWVNEKKYYDPKNPKWCSGGECGHYTQVVWSTSRFLGCAEVKCNRKDGKPATIRVCRYDPPGNFRGRMPY